MTDKSVLVTLRNAEGDDLARTRKAVEKLGLVVETVVPRAGVVAGRIKSSKIPDLEKLDNVLSVREEGVVRLPPLHGRVPQ